MSTTLLEAWGAWMLAMAWQAALLVALVWALDRVLLRRAWPALRHGLWLLVALKLVLPPTLTSPVSLTADAARLVDAPAAELAATATTSEVLAGLFLAWLLGGIACVLLMVRRRGARQRLALGAWIAPASVQARARAAAARLGLRRVPCVAVSPAVRSPLVFGIRRPRVLLPASLVGAPHDTLDHVLLHELAHIRRGDLWMQTAYAMLGLVYWFHPFVRIAQRRANAAREVCCDITVAGALAGEAGAYRSTLLRMAARLVEPTPRVGALGFVFPRSMILTRLQALDQHAAHPRGAARLVAAVALVGAAFVLLPMAFEAVDHTAARLAQTEARLSSARAHLDDTLQGDGRYGCFDKRLAYYAVRGLEADRAALIDSESTAASGGPR